MNDEKSTADEVRPVERVVMWRISSAQSGSLTVSREDARGANYWILYPRTKDDQEGRWAVARALEAWLNGAERGPELNVLYRTKHNEVMLQNGHRVVAGWGDKIDQGLLIDAICNDARPAT